MKINILNVLIDNVTKEEALATAMKYLEGDKHRVIVTPNPEFVMLAQEDTDFRRILNEADLAIADGIGIVLASKLQKTKLKERVTGYDFILNIFERIKGKPVTVYILGAAKGVAELAREKLTETYDGLKIIGCHDGYFDEKEEKIIIAEIQKKKPDILLVGLSFPRQEKWIYRNKSKLPVKMSIACGGSLDGFAGVVKRAPVFFQRTGLEWFYRLMKQPSRRGRMMKLPQFAWRVIVERLKRKRE